MLESRREGEKSASEIVMEVSQSQSNVSNHLSATIAFFSIQILRKRIGCTNVVTHSHRAGHRDMIWHHGFTALGYYIHL